MSLLALGSPKLTAQTRRAKFAELRGWLKQTRHGEAGYLQYRTFRRVINLPLKSNGMY